MVNRDPVSVDVKKSKMGRVSICPEGGHNDFLFHWIGLNWVGLDQNENENDLQGSISICPGDGDNEFSHFPAGVPFPLD